MISIMARLKGILETSVEASCRSYRFHHLFRSFSGSEPSFIEYIPDILQILFKLFSALAGFREVRVDQFEELFFSMTITVTTGSVFLCDFQSFLLFCKEADQGKNVAGIGIFRIVQAC